MKRTVFLTATVAAVALGGCTLSSSSSANQSAAASQSAADAASPTTLRVLASSEVKDMEPILAEAQRATGVTVKLAYAGTVDGSEQVASGDASKAYDATWFASNRYLSLVPGGTKAVTNPTKIMASPVVVGVRASVAKSLGWDTTAPTWTQISQAVAAKRFTYGMTNPASSNSGFSALVGVATALAGGGAALDAARITAVTPKLKTFFAGQKLTSGSSGWLADRYASGASGVDGLFNYESVLLDLNGRLSEKLVPVYPTDGVVSADYPLSLLSSAQPKQAAFLKVTEWLRTPEVQRRIMTQTHRRPVVPGVALAPEFGNHLLLELPFPAQRSAADGLVTVYLDTIRRPSQTIYVLDTSGSMKGARLEELKRAFATLSGSQSQGQAADRFTTFRTRERVLLEPFASDVSSIREFQVPQQNPQAELDLIDSAVQGLSASGGTALYSALDTAYREAGRLVQRYPDTFTSIVLMTDGEKTEGIDAGEFLQRYNSLAAPVKTVPTFTVLFGDSSPRELTDIATATRGKVFDARKTPLSQVFKEIRGYQ